MYYITSEISTEFFLVFVFNLTFKTKFNIYENIYTIEL